MYNVNIKELEKFFNAKGNGLALEKIKFDKYLVCDRVQLICCYGFLYSYRCCVICWMQRHQLMMN